MKQLLPLFLFLLPCLALAQYPSNGNQKITLGEQTTADGLIWRGVAADTTLTAKSDTAAYFVLDTVNINLYTYKASATGRKWRQLGADTAAIAYVNTYETQTVGGAKTFSSTVTGARFDPTSSSVSGTGMYLPSSGKLGFSISGTQKMNLVSNGVGYGTDLFPWISGISFTLDFPQFAISSGANGGGLLMSNFYINSSNDRIYKTTNGASFINTQAGVIAFSTAPSGTINTVATFNPISLLIASNGNVGITTSNPTEKLHVVGNARITANIAAGVTSATARLHLAAGTATASTAPLKFTSGVNLTSPLGGEMEFNGTNLFFSPSTTRHTVNHGLTGSATLNFPSTTTLLSADLTITVTGAADGDVVSLGVPNAAVNANTSYSAWVSAANTVTVRFNNYSSGTVDPASALFKVFVTK